MTTRSWYQEDTNDVSMNDVHSYENDLHAQADELERKADQLRSALLVPSMREGALREEAAHLRNMAR